MLNVMGVKVSKHSNSKGEVKSLSSSVGRSSQRSSSIIESMKPECMKKRKTKTKTKKKKKPRKMTLGDWLLASPGPTGSNPNSLLRGELYVFKNLSKRVHRSPSREHKKDGFTSDLCCGGDVSGSSYERNQSGKLKKKVSFKLPEEGDIVVFYSAAETFESE
ncbi:hypothetical protein HRI_005124400 [Hibiscus trionum]|uniref:Uncharacterized protein n=1 Tax=Hibiscus trionum TaxID=183268 RepID=A0A9W7JJW0_HIBTR|nr:hypothetical protein HRI_005124400 [Hibiscus trionum]